MNDPNRTTKWVVVIALVVLSLAVLYPPERKLKGGIDLVGGTSLLYEIDTTGLEGQDTRNLSSRVMHILKERIDPKAQLNLEWRPVGATRLEIRMPRPPKAALERRAKYNETVDQIQAINLKRREVEETLGATDNREAQLKALERGLQGRREVINKVASAYDALQQAKSGGADASATDTASKTYEAAMSELLATNLPVGRLTDVLALPWGPSRDEQIEKLRKEFVAYDAGAAQDVNGKILTKAVAAYDDWAADKADLEDPSDLKQRLKGAGVLEFRILAERDRSSPDKIHVPDDVQLQQPISKYTQQLASQGPRKRSDDHFRWFPIEDVLDFANADTMEKFKAAKDIGLPIIEEYAGRYYVLMHDDAKYKMTKGIGQSSWELRSAFPDRNALTGENVVSFTLNPRGGQLFGELTGGNVERQLSILLDQQAISHARINERITEHCQISGRFSSDDVMSLVGVLEAGSLPARLKDIPLSEETIGPSLGETNRRHGLQASLWGAALVAVFVLFYYGFAGGGTVVLALSLNLLFTLAIMAMMQATFTLPGIAGLLLSIGMAIDANVLIFERIREERERGVPFKKALSLGYDKAFSAILDGNMTVMITCIILGFVGSEEIKGFAITLGIGITISMFTALTVTRLVFNTLVNRGVLHDFSMRKLIGVPTIDWIGLRRMFWPASLIAVALGMGLFFYMVGGSRRESFFDIEFLGGTSVQVDFKKSVTMTDDQVRDSVTSTGTDKSAVNWLLRASDEVAKTTVGPGEVPGQFVVTSNTLSGDELAVLLRGPLDTTIEQRDGIRTSANSATFIGKGGLLTDESMKSAVARAAQAARDAADRLRGARVQSVGERDAEGRFLSYEIVTVETNRPLVQQAILATLGDKLDVQRKLNFTTATDSELNNNEPFFVVESEDHYLSDVLKTDAQFDIRRFRGGVVVSTQLGAGEQPIAVKEFESRLREVGLTPEFEQFRTRETAVFPLGAAQTVDGKPAYKEFAVASVDESLLYDENPNQWTEVVAPSVLQQVQAALGIEKSLSKVVQFAPQIAGQTAKRAIFATILAALGIGAYVWMRFGTREFALAVLVTLVHDVCIVLGMIAASHWIYGIFVGRALMINDFRFDLTVLAAVLTIIGYSLNDTIVVFDRIRETRGRTGALSANLINSSINQTMSRTILTGLLVFMTVIVLYVFGGDGIHGFAYVMLIGTLVGTYSTVAIAVPLVYQPKLLYKVVTVIVALLLVGLVALVSPSTIATLVIGAAILVGAGVIMARSNRMDSDILAGQPA